MLQSLFIALALAAGCAEGPRGVEPSWTAPRDVLDGGSEPSDVAAPDASESAETDAAANDSEDATVSMDAAVTADATLPVDAGVTRPEDAASTTWPGFSATPIVEGVSADDIGRFQAADAGSNTLSDASGEAPPCLSEPAPGTLFPRDWLRPRFVFGGTAEQKTFELTLHEPGGSALKVFTNQTQWTMPAELWQALSSQLQDQEVAVEVRAQTSAGVVSSAASASFKVAPVTAGGSIVYWTTSNGTRLKGFQFGRETVTEVLRPQQSGTGVQCIGCHSSTPDGLYAGFSKTAKSPDNADPSQFGLRSVDGMGSEPPFLSAAARTLLDRESYKAPVFSAAHWKSGDHIALSAFLVNNRWEAAWVDLEATSTDQNVGWGVLTRNGDPNQVVAPAFSRDGTRVIYTASAQGGNGIVGTPDSDLYSVPWNERRGGDAKKLQGASDPAFVEYYPHFSPGDNLLAFSRVPNAEQSFNNPTAEVLVVPASGGVAQRLKANDPVACTGKVSPGLTNSWPKWAPTESELRGKTYYWLTFSSTRLVSGKPQLFVTPVVVEGGNITSFPALHLWNQPADEGNHTPAWDVFQIGSR